MTCPYCLGPHSLSQCKRWRLQVNPSGRRIFFL